MDLPEGDDTGELRAIKSEQERMMSRPLRATYGEEASSISSVGIVCDDENEVPDDGEGNGNHDEDAALLDLPGDVRDNDRPDGCHDERRYSPQLHLDGRVSSERPDDRRHESRKSRDRDLNEKDA